MMKQSFQPKFMKTEATLEMIQTLQDLEKINVSFSPSISRDRTTSNDSTFSLSSSYSSPSSLTGTPSKRKSITKKVRFEPTAHVVLIPTLEEYKEAKLHRRLWYDNKELKIIEKDAIVEISTGKLFTEKEDFWSFLPHIDG